MKDCCTFKQLKLVYNSFCVISVFGLILWCIYLFSLDEDLARINIKKFNSDEYSLYTSVSFVVYSPYVYEKFEKYNDKNITPVNYKLYLQGEFWNENISSIDYNDVAIKIGDYFLGYEILYDNDKRVSYGNHITDQSGWEPPYPNGNLSIGKIFTVDIPFRKDVSLRQLDIKLRASIFPNKNRPPKLTTKNGVDGFGVFFHFPKQGSSTKTFRKIDWPYRSENASKSYYMVFELKNIEIVQNRNKWRQKCLTGLPDIDQMWYTKYFKQLNCKPPYFNGIGNLSPCETQNDLNQIHKDYFQYRLSSKSSEIPPCRSLEKLEFGYYEYDVEEDKEPNITISIIFVDQNYREMLNIRAFDLHSLLGNIGGYVGIFIGYALLNLPDAILRMKKKIGNKRTNKGDEHKSRDEEKFIEDVNVCSNSARINRLEEQMKHVLQTLQVKQEIVT